MKILNKTKPRMWGMGLALALAWMLGVAGCVPLGGVAETGVNVSAVTPLTWVDVAAPQDRKPVSLSFQDGRRASGFAGCNGYASQVDFTAQALTFKSTATTRMLCEPEAMDTEQRYLKALDNTRSARLHLGVLELLDAQRKVLWRFKPVT
jgi:heat shock protein HslJ